MEPQFGYITTQRCPKESREPTSRHLPIIPVTFTESNRFPISQRLGPSPRFHLINWWCERNMKVGWAAWKSAACTWVTQLSARSTPATAQPLPCVQTLQLRTDICVVWHEHFRNWIFHCEQHYRPQIWECFIKSMYQKEEENREEKMKKKWRIKKQSLARTSSFHTS